MKIKRDGPKRNIARYETILTLRRKKKSESEIAAQLGITKQAVSYYVCKYGDVKKRGVDNYS